MTRMRISTTVDADRLADARARSGLRDSELFDRALELLIRRLVIDAELSSLDRFPYELDSDLDVGDAPGDPEGALRYDGDVPERIQQLALERRAEREQRAS